VCRPYGHPSSNQPRRPRSKPPATAASLCLCSAHQAHCRLPPTQRGIQTTGHPRGLPHRASRSIPQPAWLAAVNQHGAPRVFLTKRDLAAHGYHHCVSSGGRTVAGPADRLRPTATTAHQKPRGATKAAGRVFLKRSPPRQRFGQSRPGCRRLGAAAAALDPFGTAQENRAKSRAALLRTGFIV